MPRIRIELPEHFTFTTPIPIRITDLNYGKHVGNDTILSLLHEARAQFLAHHGFTELDVAGTALIMADVAIEFKKEIFYGDKVLASVAAGDFTRVGFTLYYTLEKEEAEASGNAGGGKKEAGKEKHKEEGRQEDALPKKTLLAAAQTGMVCYSYEQKKVTAVPELAIKSLQ